MELNINQKLNQKLSPQTLQYMKLLQMNSSELSSYVETLALENPIVELAEPKQNDDWAKIKWLGQAPKRASVSDEDNDYKDATDYKFGRFSGSESLYDNIRLQLISAKRNEQLSSIALMLARNLDSRGYLDSDFYEQMCTNLGTALCANALALLQSTSPAGIGARRLEECLLLQLRRQEGNTELAQKIVEFHLDKLAAANFQLISRILEVPLNAVYSACATIRSLSPFPGSLFSDGKQTQYIVPDLYVDKDLNISLNASWMPTINISHYYTTLASTTEDAEVKSYLDEKLTQAKWAISAVENRNSTLLKCTAAIVEAQADFFRGKTALLKPLRQVDIAEKIGFHDSTISRVIRGKYINCVFGTFPFEHFFVNAVSPNAGSDDGVSVSAIQAQIAELIEKEDRKKPLSDEAITAILAGENMHVSRRTIAKYRSQLGIANTAARRAQYFSQNEDK